MSTLVLLEHRRGRLCPDPLGLLSKALLLDDDVAAVVVAGGGAPALAAEAGRFGARVVHVAEDAAFEHPLPQPHVDVVARVVRDGGYDTVLLSNSVLAADVAGGLAARLGAGLNWDLVDLSVDGGVWSGTRPALGDSVHVEVGWRSTPRLALCRAGAFEPVERPVEPQSRPVPAVPSPRAPSVTVLEHRPAPDEGPSLEAAEVVVTGGMGLGGAEHFALAEQLAEVLGGVVGATRAAVYAGWRPPSAQIGQTGKTVAPRLYVALGVSGAVQHKVGMQRSRTVVAVNTDPRAPIFEFCDLAVVGDVHRVVPALVELLRARKGS